MPITLSETANSHSIASIKRYLSEQLDQDVGDLQAGLLLEFVLKEIGPSIYNAALSDAQSWIRDHVADLDGACALSEFAYWPDSVRRRPPR